MKTKTLLTTMLLLMTALTLMPMASAHDCSSDTPSEQCGDCTEGTHDHNDTHPYNEDGDSSCESSEELGPCDVYRLIQDLITSGDLAAAQKLIDSLNGQIDFEGC